jgi:hypothetical protein
MIDTIGQRYVQRSAFERQFIRCDGELRFLDGPFRPVRFAPEAEREKYIDLAMSHAATAAGWFAVAALPFSFVLFLLPPGLLLFGLLFDAIMIYAIIHVAPEVRSKRQRVRALVNRWPVAEAASPSRYFQRFWSGESFSKVSARDRRVLFWSGLLFTAGGGLLIAANIGIIGWPSLAMGILSFIVAGLAQRAA